MHRLENIARTICNRSCLKAELYDTPCLGKCEANAEQLMRSWRGDAARDAIEAMTATPAAPVS
jgi:hypothetical protein